MIKILYALNCEFHKGGTEAVVLNILKFIDKENFNIDFLVHADEEEGKTNSIHKELTKQGITIHYVTPRKKSVYKNYLDIKSILKNNMYDIAHSHMDAAGYFFLKEAKKQGVKVLVAHSHNSGSEVLSKGVSLKTIAHYFVLQFAKIKLRKTADYFISCSDLAGQWLFGSKICSSKNYMMFRNAIDVESYIFKHDLRKQYRQELHLDNKFVIGHIGRFEKQKNHDFLLDIFEKIVKIKPDSELILVGEGTLLSSIKQKVKVMGLDNKVNFLGVRSDISGLMCSMDAFLFPSLYEGLPVTLVETQANGLKIVASDNISKDTVLTEDIILLSTELTAKEWALKVIDACYGKQHSDNMIELKEKGFDMRNNVKTLEDTYFELLRGKL